MKQPQISLQSILASGRPYRGRMESHLRDRIKRIYGGIVDAAGNLSLALDAPDGAQAHVLFSAHLDTVHRTDGYVGFKQRGQIYAAYKECLGADDGAGIWLLLRMIDNGIPGTYVFTVGEECGLAGATRYVVPKHIQACIAFDRRGTTDVVYHQVGRPTGSLQAAQWLCDQLKMSHKPSTGGCFTDNEAWADAIPECLNVAVGYSAAHTPAETLDAAYLNQLLLAILAVDWASMPIIREPWEWRDPWELATVRNMGSSSADILKLVKEQPDVAASLLEQHVDPEELFWSFMGGYHS